MIDFAVIGTNFITDRFLEAASSVPEFRLKAVYSRSMEKAEDYARRHGAELTFDSLDELAACPDVDAVYVASQIQGENGVMLIDRIQEPQEVTICFRDGREKKLDSPKSSNNMVYETEEFIRLIHAGAVEHRWLKNSETEMRIMDEARAQQGIRFQADR